jgi:hypothetical protein
MVQHRLVRVHDAAGKDAINEKIIKIEPFITFRGIYDALDPDRPRLKVNVSLTCQSPEPRPSRKATLTRS